MPSVPVIGSANISSLDSRIVADLCVGKIFIDATPSVFIGTGANNILGIKVQLVNPYNIAIKDYGEVYDIPAPATAVYVINIPTQGGGYQAGLYKATLQVTDAGGATTEVEKVFTICQPDRENKAIKYGTLGARLEGICNEGKLKVSVSNPPTYNGLVSTSAERAFVLKYPTGSGLPPKDTTVTSFTTYLFDGAYNLSGQVCAAYAGRDGVSFKVKYLLNQTTEVRCSVDECCILSKLAELHQGIASGCSEEEQNHLANTTLDVLRLFQSAKLAAACGSDASAYILDLERLLNCSCSVKAESGTPLYNNNPSRDFVIQGCNVQKQEVGFTTQYTIENYAYEISSPGNGNIFTVSAPQLDQNCVKRQVATFDPLAMYGAVKDYAQQNNVEANAWASVVKKALNGLNVSTLGLTNLQLQTLTLAQLFQAIINKIKSCCDCAASITTHTTTISANDVLLRFTSVAYAVDVYVDGVLIDTVIADGDDTILLARLADGTGHEYTLVPRCINGTTGASVTGRFRMFGCPSINPPAITQTNVQNAVAPYNLSVLFPTTPAAYSVEVHSENNTSPQTIVPLSSYQAITQNGYYHVFYKDASGCYSTGIAVLVTLATQGCSAPRNLRADKVNGGVEITFNAALTPPPSNSYTVRRKIEGSLDTTAVTIGSTGVSGIIFKASINRWIILDPTAQDNTNYTYIAISNCGSTLPRMEVNYSNYPTCAIITGLTVTINP